MGKTGSISWVKVKGRKGKVIKVQKSQAQKAHPGTCTALHFFRSQETFHQKICKSPCKVILRAFSLLFLDIILKHSDFFITLLFCLVWILQGRFRTTA